MNEIGDFDGPIFALSAMIMHFTALMNSQNIILDIVFGFL